MEKKDKTILIAAALLAFGMIFNGGIYEFYTRDGTLISRFNKFTGSIDLCVPHKHCKAFDAREQF